MRTLSVLLALALASTARVTEPNAVVFQEGDPFRVVLSALDTSSSPPRGTTGKAA